MREAERQKIIQGIERCLGIDNRRCEGCPFKRFHGRDDGKCLERLLEAVHDDYAAQGIKTNTD